MITKSEIWDNMHYIFEEYNDHMMHAGLYFDKQINFELFKKALGLIYDAIPILKSKFVLNEKKNYWETIENFDVSNYCNLVITNDIGDVDKFLVTKINQTTEPQMKINIYRCDNKDNLSILFNHQVCDGSGFKEILKALEATYNELLTNPDYKPNITVGNRTLTQIYKNLSFKNKLKVCTRFKQGKKNNKKIGFPFATNDKSKLNPIIAKYKLTADKFVAIKKWGKDNGYTVNDLIMASYIMSLHDTITAPADEPIEVDMIIDLRRNMKDGKSKGLSNFVSSTKCAFSKNQCTDIITTLKIFSEFMKQNMTNFPGYSGIPRLMIGFKLFPFKTIHKLVLKQFNNPLIAISNIGIAPALTLGDAKLIDVYMTGSIKFPPYMQLAVASFNNALTFTIAEYRTEEDAKTIAKFFVNLEKHFDEMMTIISK